MNSIKFLLFSAVFSLSGFDFGFDSYVFNIENLVQDLDNFYSFKITTMESQIDTTASDLFLSTYMDSTSDGYKVARISP